MSIGRHDAPAAVLAEWNGKCRSLEKEGRNCIPNVIDGDFFNTWIGPAGRGMLAIPVAVEAFGPMEDRNRAGQFSRVVVIIGHESAELPASKHAN
jgi:hypothetical protein